jgi:hypothetical protein
MNPVTYMPELDDVMYNYMKSSNLIFGRKLKYCCSYKINHRGVDIYSRKYENCFKGRINTENFSNSIIIESKKLNSILVSKKDKIQIFDSTDYSLRMTLPIAQNNIYISTDRREPFEIIGM